MTATGEILRDDLSEYIIACDEETASWVGNDVESMQPLVRCRDCKHCDTYITRWTKKPIHECLAEWCEGSEGDHPLVESNWFCSWGERKENEENLQEGWQTIADELNAELGKREDVSEVSNNRPRYKHDDLRHGVETHLFFRE